MAMLDTHTIDGNGNSLLELFRKFEGAMDRREVAEAKVLKKFNSWIDNFPDEHVVFRSNKFSRYVRDVKKRAKYCSFPILKAALESWRFGNKKYIEMSRFSGTEAAHDNDLPAAIKLYQRSFRLNVTGILDPDTVTQMMKPRCGVPDHVMIKPKNRGHQDDQGKSFHTVAHYQFIPGNPRWSNKQLTYTFRSTAQVPDDLNVRSAFKSAFQSWAQVTDFSFEEVATGGSDDADIVIGFHRRDHGDREPFDGFQGVLAHSLPPTAGTSHYDADEKWSSNSNPGLDELDLESVALHEIGHVLGLGHETRLREAVMYPTISYGQTKRDLNDDDIQDSKRSSNRLIMNNIFIEACSRNMDIIVVQVSKFVEILFEVLEAFYFLTLLAFF
ncbi:hypothetical protein LWI28_004504 [Acer negundo]|uniref:Peptidase metallopeptidase domain-containing protein n=1 Tax=Acer negundo TaxID=4023 RepID=A0AAD5I8K1_ACENE|nr:hypothetical protein LWI28_004504 [Acer negundo]